MLHDPCTGLAAKPGLHRIFNAVLTDRIGELIALVEVTFGILLVNGAHSPENMGGVWGCVLPCSLNRYFNAEQHLLPLLDGRDRFDIDVLGENKWT
ncbi:hypothetical protein SDC9_97917 [bioreactor metagenome]|uniref:Uncharacterized protein n=1 Tax=bioreactor metagenome TaxID=1076179 RepID=A0A645ADC9_9ZZZZ